MNDAIVLARLLLAGGDEPWLRDVRSAFYHRCRSGIPEERLSEALRELESQHAVLRWLDFDQQEIVLDIDRDRLVALTAPAGPRGRLSELGS